MAFYSNHDFLIEYLLKKFFKNRAACFYREPSEFYALTDSVSNTVTQQQVVRIFHTVKTPQQLMGI
jgi:hypothetical protein